MATTVIFEWQGEIEARQVHQRFPAGFLPGLDEDTVRLDDGTICRPSEVHAPTPRELAQLAGASEERAILAEAEAASQQIQKEADALRGEADDLESDAQALLVAARREVG